MAGKGHAGKAGQRAHVRYTVDLWWSDLNPTEIGLFKKTRQRAKSRQFTKDADIIGSVERGGERTGLISYREGAWKDQQGMAKRLVLKLFSANLNWRATMDLLVGRSVQLSFGAGGFPVTAFSVNVARHDQMINIERSARKWPGFPEKYSFFILKDGAPRLYKLRRDWVSIGADYTIYDQNNRRIGHLNGRVLDLGGRWDVTLDSAHDYAELNAVIQLFCAMLRFDRRCQNHVAELVANIERDKLHPALASEEIELYLNPRRVR